MSILDRYDRDGVAHLTMMTPKTLNVLSDEMISALQSQFDALQSDDDIRAVILSAQGSAFCAGHDLKQISEHRQSEDQGASYFSDLFKRCAKMMTSITDLPQPLIAQVQGVATAAGCQLVASCDIVIASTAAKFGVNGVNIGLFCSTPAVALSRTISRKHAFEMLTTGCFIDAHRAEALGLVNRVVQPEQLAEETLDIASTVAGKLASAVTVGKQAFYQQLSLSVEEAYSYSSDIMKRNMMNQDTEEGIAAFLEKRPPNW
ncbi:MAG: enoyl-CoA hydratase [Aestuariivita sp.]|nr:enoyl-CoA hydratase [Aestuariivita sp.]MCY4345885.1 enoyl-CoA hydratase [Aestuariivita sp.]